MISISLRTDSNLCTLTTVQVDDHLQAGSPSPVDCFVQVWQLPFDVWVAVQVLHSPVADGDSNVVHSRGRNLVDIILGDEGAPVLGQNRTTLVGAQGRAESPLINGSIAGRIEDRGSDPRLRD